MRMQRKQYEVSIPTSAMGDIAFLLLIFFVILARVQDDSHLEWQPATTPELERADNVKASVLIDVDNKTYLNGQETSHGQLAKQLTDILKDAPTGERTVLLKVNHEATAVYFEPVIEAISEAGGDLLHVLEEEHQK